ncbi:MAG: peptidoglycan DD-metalloendopeptidase family protein [Saccharospirillaceae bacterium]|nr:peptidase M23 [Thalassolituus sp. HI0120]MCH2042085.1 peptidoglycan DD-metalloendopeptidase family protein [Saccharospirillaceae bacterium]
MALPGRLQYFPVSHLAGALGLFLTLMIVSFWPTSAPKNLQQTRIVVEIPEKEQPPQTPEENWQEAQVRAGENLSLLFDRFNLSAVDVLEIAAAAPKQAIRLHPNQTLRWVTSGDHRIQKFEIILSPLARHSLVRDAEGKLQYELRERNADYRPRFASATIDNSLFLDGGRAGVPEQILIELAGIFGWDIDFALDIRQGDRFSLIYEEIFLDGEKIGNGNILIARFHNRGREITAVRYEDAKGNANYYTPTGLSMRKEFLRNPIDFARISSRFNLRRKHPVLNKIRAHRGTDYAAARGTPIKAAGDGKVTFAGRKGGFGNVVIIQHGSRYQTLYAHLSKFGRGVRKGRKVKQGKIIGYVGSTGLATGPHLHYEFRVDGVHRDSLRIKLPQARSISKKQKADFLTKASSLVEWLNSHNPQSLVDAMDNS